MIRRRVFLLLSLVVFIGGVQWTDRRLWKASHGFCLHVIEAPIPSLPDCNPSLPFPKELLSQPFHYLGKGAQSFVFESADGTTVLKFYRYPSHLRRFPWAHHPFGYCFSSSRLLIKEHNLRRLKLSFHSFFLAAEPLKDETAVLYVHLQPTSHLQHRVELIDRIGVHYNLPLDTVAFIVQKKGTPFFSAFQQQFLQGDDQKCQQMIDALIEVIVRRCRYNITDLDNMANDNYGWLDDQAIHLDIGRFQEKEMLECPAEIRKEVVRVTAPLLDYLQKTSSELYSYFLQKVDTLSSCDCK